MNIIWTMKTVNKNKEKIRILLWYDMETMGRLRKLNCRILNVRCLTLWLLSSWIIQLYSHEVFKEKKFNFVSFRHSQLRVQLLIKRTIAIVYCVQSTLYSIHVFFFIFFILIFQNHSYHWISHILSFLLTFLSSLNFAIEKKLFCVSTISVVVRKVYFALSTFTSGFDSIFCGYKVFIRKNEIRMPRNQKRITVQLLDLNRWIECCITIWSKSL